MLIDCESCVVKGVACAGCVVSVMLGAAPEGVDLDDGEQRALAVLADAGMVPHLRLVTADHPEFGKPTDGGAGDCHQPGPGWPAPDQIHRIA